MKGQAVYVWIFGLVTIFSLIVIYTIFVPFISHSIADPIKSINVNQTEHPDTGTVNNVIDSVRMTFPLAILTLIVGVVIYMLASMQKEEEHVDSATF